MAAKAARSLQRGLVWLVAWVLPVQAARSGLSLLGVLALALALVLVLALVLARVQALEQAEVVPGPAA